MTQFVSNNVASGAVIFASDHNEMGSRIAAVVNGGLDDNNISGLSGSKITAGTIPSTALDTNTAGGWIAGLAAPSSVTYNGNRSYSLVFSGTDYTSTISPGMRLKTTRSVTAPTQCTSLNGSTQYYSKSSPAGMTFTDDFAGGAWIKLSSYPSSDRPIISRYNGTSGWYLAITSNGSVVMIGYNAGSANYSYVNSYQSVPLNKWIHIAAQLDMSSFTNSATTSYVMIEGVDVPALVSRGGTNPTALVQAGDLNVGAYNSASNFFPGKIAQVAVFNAKVTQATMRGYISQGLAGTETSLISAYSFNNSINDLNTGNANNLTAAGSAVATNADSPFCGQASSLVNGNTDFSIVESCTFSTDTTMVVRASEVCTIPTTGGVSTVSYSPHSAAYGLPGDTASVIGRRLVYIPINAQYATTSTTGVQFPPVTNYSITIPKNCYEIKIGFVNPSFSTGGTAVFKVYNGAINTTANELVQFNYTAGNSGVSVSAPVPVVPGEVLSLNVGWLTTSGTLTWSSSGANRQAPAFWVETA